MSNEGRLALLIGLEKLYGVRGMRVPPIEYSEAFDGERGGMRAEGDNEDVDPDIRLLEEGCLDGTDVNDAPMAVGSSSSELSAGTGLILDVCWKSGDLGGASAFVWLPLEVVFSFDDVRRIAPGCL